MFDLTGFQRDLLYIIDGVNGAQGTEIKAELEAYYEGEITHGRLYSNLDVICEKGLANKEKKDDRTNRYTITGRGRRELIARRSWKNQYEENRLGDVNNGP